MGVLDMLHEGKLGSGQLSSPPLWGSAHSLTWISTGAPFNAQCIISAHMSPSLSRMNRTKGGSQELPAGPVARTACFHCRDPGSVSSWRTKIPHGREEFVLKHKKGPLDGSGWRPELAADCAPGDGEGLTTGDAGEEEDGS